MATSKRKLSLLKHPEDEQIQAISGAQQQRDRWTQRRGEERRGIAKYFLIIKVRETPVFAQIALISEMAACAI